jgi:hypothetical protein
MKPDLLRRCGAHRSFTLAVAGLLLAYWLPGLAQGQASLRPWAECSMADPAEYRPAEASDYAGPAWRHWSTHTGSNTPWRVQADFDGDGQDDVAWVAIHRQRPLWIMGVDYGRKADQPCRVQQILSVEEMQRLPALLAWPLGVDSLVCHGAETGYAARCTAPEWSRFQQRDGVAIIAADALPQEVHLLLNHWRRIDMSQRDGHADAVPGEDRAKRRFEVRKILPELDMEASQRVLSPNLGSAGTPELLQAAFQRLEREARYIRHAELGEPGSPLHSRVEVRRLGEQGLHLLEHGARSGNELLIRGNEAWIRHAGVEWQPIAIEMARLLAPAPAAPRLLGEVSVREEQIDDRRVRIVEGRSADQAGEARYRAELDPDSGRLQMERIVHENGVGPQVLRYDYDTTFELPRVEGD